MLPLPDDAAQRFAALRAATSLRLPDCCVLLAAEAVDGSPSTGASLGRLRVAGSLVYPLHMSRTNVELDDELVERVMGRYGVATKRAAIDLALRRLDIEPMSREEALAMEGTGWEGALEELRGSRTARAAGS